MGTLTSGGTAVPFHSGAKSHQMSKSLRPNSERTGAEEASILRLGVKAWRGAPASLLGLETLRSVQYWPLPQVRLYCIAAAVVALTYPMCGGLLCLGVKERPGIGCSECENMRDRSWEQDSSWS